MDKIRVNLRATVNAADIRTEQHNGREHIVVPSYTLPDGVVMNGGLYPKEEIDAAFNTLDGTLAPIGHPKKDGQFVSANSAEAINAYHVGAWNRNVRREGSRVYVEKWIDKETASNSEKGRELLAAIDKREPIHTSTGVFLRRETVANADGYEWIARDMTLDHDAILINEIGAATPEQGVGLFVNVDEAVPLEIAANLSADSANATRNALRMALKAKYDPQDNGLYVEDYDATMVVFETDTGPQQVGYTMAGGVVTLADAPVKVESRTVYIPLVNKILQMLRAGLHSGGTVPVQTTNANEGDDMTPEELKAALAAQAETLGTAFNAKFDAMAEQITTLQTNLNASAEAANASKRAVVAQAWGEVVANGLNAEALEDAYTRVSKGKPLVAGGFDTNTDVNEFADVDLNAGMGAK